MAEVIWCRCPYGSDLPHLHGSWCQPSRISEKVEPIKLVESRLQVGGWLSRLIPARVKSPVADTGWR